MLLLSSCLDGTVECSGLAQSALLCLVALECGLVQGCLHQAQRDGAVQTFLHLIQTGTSNPAAARVA